MPGSPLDPRAEGTNDLLKQGATLVTEADDVIAVLRADPRPAARSSACASRERDTACRRQRPGGDERGESSALLGPTPVEIDDLVRLSGAAPRSCGWCCWNSNSPAGSTVSPAAVLPLI